MNLQNANPEIKETKKQYLLERLDHLYKTGMIKSKAELQEAKNKIDSLPLDSVSTIVRKQTDSIEATPINQSFQELTIDFNVLFRQLDGLDQSINRQLRLNQSSIENNIMDLKSLNEELNRATDLIDNGGQQTSYKESFRDAFNLELNPDYLLDRNGSPLPPVHLDPEFECIKLPLINQENRLVNVIGQSVATIKILRQVGEELMEKENPESSLDKAIDTSPDSYWYRSILSDEPIKVSFGPEAYDIKEGTPFIVEITFNSAQAVNQLSFKPFARFPMDIINVMAFTSDDLSETPTTLVSPFQGNPDLKSVSTKDPHIYYFPDLIVKKFWIIMNQRHYIERDIILSSREQAKQNSLLEPIAITAAAGTVNFATYETMIEEVPLWPAFLKSTKKLSTDIDKILEAEKQDIRIPALKYQYEMGMYDIGVKYNQFAQTACYVSKPIAQDGIVREASLLVNEKNPVFINSMLGELKLANIEYSIAGAGTTFYPIVPINVEVIYNELLLIKWNTIRGRNIFGGSTHAEYDRILAVRCNGFQLKPNIDYSIQYGFIVISDWKFDAVYTVDYVPTEDAKVVKFDLKGESITETFHGTDGTGKIHLSQYHYLDRVDLLRKRGLSWDPSLLSSDLVPAVVTIKLPDGNVISQPLQADETRALENKTDYFDGLLEMNQFTGDKYEYYIYGKELQFNTVLPKDAVITVTYHYLVDTLRLKAIMRRVMTKQTGATPIINDYTLLTKLME